MSLLALLASEASTTSDPLDRYRSALATRATTPLVIAAAGDSLTDMDATTIDGNGWTARLARKLLANHGGPVTFYDVHATVWDATPTASPGIHVVNAGNSGSTSYNYLADGRQARITETHPDVVMHMVGMNNYTFTTWSPAAVANDIAGRCNALDAAITSAGSTMPLHLILVEPRSTADPPPAGRTPAWWDGYRVELQRIVAEKPDNRMLVDVDAAFGSTTGLRGGDGIHLTAAGYELVATTVQAALAQ